jgi:hypothetical protein
MGDYTVIGEVSALIQSTLESELKAVDDNMIAVLDNLTETPSGTPPKLTIFLYEIGEDAPSRNRPHVRPDPANPLIVRKPPMALCLRYLITAWGGDEITQHRMLGVALRTFYDNAIFEGARLTGGLAASADALHFTLTPLTLDQRSLVWFALQKSFRLSLNYEVRVVNLDATEQLVAGPVRSRSIVPATVGRP